MKRGAFWLRIVAASGLTAGVLAVGLLWMVLTHPVTLATALGGWR